MLPNQSGVRLSAIKQGHIPKTKIGGKGKRYLLKGCTIWGHRELPDLRTISSTKHRKKNLVPKRLKPKTMPRNLTPFLSVLLESKTAKQRALGLQDSPLSLCTWPKLPLPCRGFSHQGPRGTANCCSQLCRGSICGAQHLRPGHVASRAHQCARGEALPSLQLNLPVQTSVHSRRAQLPQPIPSFSQARLTGQHLHLPPC